MQIIYNDVADHFCEWVYIQEVLKYLKPKLSDEYVLHIACLSQECNNYKNIKFVPNKKNIIIGTSDEYMQDIHPPYLNEAVAIFKQYLVPEQEKDNVYLKTYQKISDRNSILILAVVLIWDLMEKNIQKDYIIVRLLFVRMAM